MQPNSYKMHIICDVCAYKICIEENAVYFRRSPENILLSVNFDKWVMKGCQHNQSGINLLCGRQV